MKYVHLENNKILGYYSKDINPAIPKECLEITDEQWQEALSINANCYENGKFIVKDFRTSEEIEQQRVDSINAYTQSFIIKKYPLEKQSSAQLGIYGEVYLQEMKDYIANIIRISNEAEANGIKLEDILWQ